MYKAYILDKLSDWFYIGKDDKQVYSDHGNEIYDKHTNIFNKKIESFKNPRTGRLNAALLTAKWFPQINADIFISHSHQDYEDVVALAGLLKKEFNITAFIDGCLWGFCENLLKLIDDKYCKNLDENFYDYSKRNHSMSHVYMMLTMSIAKMIHNTECILFYNTPNSIVPKKEFSSTEQTLSPWLFAELEMTKIIKTRTLRDHRIIRKSMTESNRKQFSMENIEVEYDVDTSHLINIDEDFFQEWINDKYNFDNNKEALNYLYENCKTKRDFIYG